MKIKELCKIKILKKLSSEDLKNHFINLDNLNEQKRVINTVLSSGLFEIHCEFYNQVGSFSDIDDPKTYTYWRKYDTLKDKKVFKEPKQKILKALMFEGKLIKINILKSKKFIAEDNKKYKEIVIKKFIKK